MCIQLSGGSEQVFHEELPSTVSPLGQPVAGCPPTDSELARECTTCYYVLCTAYREKCSCLYSGVFIIKSIEHSFIT